MARDRVYPADTCFAGSSPMGRATNHSTPNHGIGIPHGIELWAPMWSDHQRAHLFLINKIRHRKLITLKLSKPRNKYCGVLDRDRNGCRPSQSRHLSHPLFPPFHILDFGTGPLLSVQAAPSSATLAQRHPRSVQGPQTPEHPHRSWCECSFQLWMPDTSAKATVGLPISLISLFQGENKQEKGGTPWCPVPPFSKTG